MNKREISEIQSINIPFMMHPNTEFIVCMIKIIELIIMKSIITNDHNFIHI